VGIIIIIYVVFDLTFAGGTPTLKFVTWWYNENKGWKPLHYTTAHTGAIKVTSYLQCACYTIGVDWSAVWSLLRLFFYNTSL